MKILIAIAFIAASGAAVLSHAQILSATSMVPLIIFGVALILTLLHLVNSSDSRSLT